MRKTLLKVLPVLMLALVVGVVSVSAQTETASDYVTMASDLMTDLGIFPIVVATAIVGLALYLFRKARSASR